MLGIKNGFINLEFRTIEEVLSDKYISKEAKFATSIKHQLQKSPEVEELSNLTIDDERKDTSTELQHIPQQQESDE